MFLLHCRCVQLTLTCAVYLCSTLHNVHFDLPLCSVDFVNFHWVLVSASIPISDGGVASCFHLRVRWCWRFISLVLIMVSATMFVEGDLVCVHCYALNNL